MYILKERIRSLGLLLTRDCVSTYLIKGGVSDVYCFPHYLWGSVSGPCFDIQYFVSSSLAIILMGKGERIAFLKLSFRS